MLEEERKYEVDAGFEVPDLDAVGQTVTHPAKTLRATYYDTVDLRLARAGVTLRFRRGDELPWTVKLPADSPGVRHEISRAAPPSAIPGELLDLVTVWHRGAPVDQVAVVQTLRRSYDLVDSGGTVLVEISDDDVSSLDGDRVVSRFRELEVELRDGERGVLDQVEAVLVAAGAVAGGFTPKHVRALGSAAEQPPDLIPPEAPGTEVVAGQVAVAAIRRDVARILGHDPLVRLRLPVGKDDTAVHQMRVGCRRLRSDLRTFGALLDAHWAGTLRSELKWLANLLGAARDLEVLRDRLRATANADPVSPVDADAVARIEATLAARHEEALTALGAGLASDQYLSLVDSLVAAARYPVLTALADEPAGEALPGLIRWPWRAFVDGKKGVHGAGDLDAVAADDAWHAVRIRGKRVRYAVQAVAPVLGGAAAELASALGRVQDLLGEHQDAAVAAATWLEIAAADPDDHVLAVTAGRLFERERSAIRAARAAFPAAWRTASRPRLTSWLH